MRAMLKDSIIKYYESTKEKYLNETRYSYKAS